MKDIVNSQPNLEEFAKNRYGDFGPLALNRLKNLCQQYDSLIVFPGLILKLEDFEKYVIENKLECGGPWQAAQAFSDSLGKVTVYRAINLSDDEFENVRKNGIESDAIRKNSDLKAYNNISFPFELLRRVRNQQVRFKPNLADRTVSLSFDPEISRTVAFAYGEYKDIDKKNMYLFKIEMPKLEDLYFSPADSQMCEYPNRNNEEYTSEFNKKPSIVRPILCQEAFYPKETETFGEYLIEPSEIKEYEKMPLTKAKIKEARNKVDEISKKQTCEEIAKFKDILNNNSYENILYECSPSQLYPIYLKL